MPEISIEVLFSFLFSITFVSLTFLVLRKSNSKTNLLFAIGSGFFGLGTFFAGLGYLYIDQKIFLWSITTSLLVFAPTGYFLSARRILTGLNPKKDIFSLIVSTFFAIISLLVLMLYSNYTSNENIILWDTFVGIGLILCATQFFKIYQISPQDLHLKLILLLLGFLIAIVSLFVNVLLILLNPSGSIILLRYGLPLLGNLLVVFSFIGVPGRKN